MRLQARSPESFFLQGTKPVGLLLIHGFTGSCAEMSLLGDYFHQRGYTVHAPLLKGHGTRAEDLERTTADDWWASVLEGYQRLKRADTSNLFVIGLSMGGLLALKLAANQPVQGVVAMAAPVFVYERLIGLSRWVYPIYRYQKHIGRDPNPEVEAYKWSYDRTPVKSAAHLYRLMKEVKRLLPRIQVPALIMQGTRDRTVSPRSAQYIYDALGSTDKQLRWYSNSGHILTLDRERQQVFEEVEEFIRRCLSEQ